MSDATLPALMTGTTAVGDRPADALNGEWVAQAPHVSRSMPEVRRLLHLAADRFIPIPDGAIETVIETDRALAKGDLPLDLEVRFWNAYSYLRANVVAATSLRTRYNLGFLVLLVLLMIVQGLYISASSLIDAIFDERSTVVAYQIGQSDACTAIDRSAGKAPVAAGQTAGTNVDADGCPLRRVTEPEYRLALSKLAGYDDVLERWVDFQPSGASPGAGQHDLADFDTARHFASLGLLFNATHFVQVFILPALYGALGASVFILRRFTQDLRSGALTEDSSLRFGLRVSIGIVAGLAIHWFIRSPDGSVAGVEDGSVPALNNLSRYALSFVGGYGSEIVFTLLDRTVAAFDQGSAAQQPATLATKPAATKPAASKPAATNPTATNATTITTVGKDKDGAAA